MKKLWTYLIAFALFLLVIPALALFPLSDKAQKPEGRYYSVKDENSGKILYLTPLDYIKGVVAAEIPIDYHTEAIKAQAVAAHSYALSQAASSLDEMDEALDGALFSTNPDKFQAYLSQDERRTVWGKSFEKNEEILENAVKSVIDEILVYDGAPAAAAFFAISNGKTESAENVWGRSLPYLVPVTSEGDSLSPDYKSVEVFTDKQLASLLAAGFPDIKFNRDREKWFSEIEKSESGNVISLKVGNTEMSGVELRDLLSLRSQCFEFSQQDGVFTFTVYGYGHDVGMSQYGADFMARQGKSYKEILQWYYSGTKLEKIK